MHMEVYIITLAENAEDAASEVRCWIDDYSGREFWDYGSVVEPCQIHLVKDIAQELENYKTEMFQLLPLIEKEWEKCKKDGDSGNEGWNHIRYGNILIENPCRDMPFFNKENFDWSIPTEVPPEAGCRDWYAVLVDLH